MDTNQARFQNVLFCTDFSENADYAFFFALDAATRTDGARLHILHVVPESESQFWKTYIYEVDNVDEKAKNDIDRRIEKAYIANIPEDLDYTIEFLIGKDWQEILAYAKEKDIDLIVMGRQGKNAIERTLFGNITEKITRKAPCATLVIPLAYQRTHDKTTQS